MTIAQMLAAELEHEGAATRRALERVPEADFDWRPHPKSMSLGRLSSHIVEILQLLDMTLEGSELDLDKREHKPWQAANRADLLATFDARLGPAVKLLAGQSDERMRETWRLILGGQTRLELPRAAVVRAMILSHTIHHRGQLTVYLRLRDVPVPAIYGPSADESPF